MNFFIIVLTSFILLVCFRLVFILLYKILSKICNASEKIGFQFALSIVFFMIYLQTFVGAVQGVINMNNTISNLEWYFIYTLIGIAAILWCYFNWELEWKAKPKFGEDDKHIMIKKIIVFTCVMIFTFYQGYVQLNKYFGGNDVDLVVSITNITIVPGIIALDRVLNQIKSLKNKISEEKQLACNEIKKYIVTVKKNK